MSRKRKLNEICYDNLQAISLVFDTKVKTIGNKKLKANKNRTSSDITIDIIESEEDIPISPRAKDIAKELEKDKEKFLNFSL